MGTNMIDESDEVILPNRKRLKKRNDKFGAFSEFPGATGAHLCTLLQKSEIGIEYCNDLLVKKREITTSKLAATELCYSPPLVDGYRSSSLSREVIAINFDNDAVLFTAAFSDGTIAVFDIDECLYRLQTG